MTAFNYYSISAELETFLDGWAQCYELDGIMNELGEYRINGGEHIQTIDDIDPDEFQKLLRKYDVFMD